MACLLPICFCELDYTLSLEYNHNSPNDGRVMYDLETITALYVLSSIERAVHISNESNIV